MAWRIVRFTICTLYKITHCNCYLPVTLCALELLYTRAIIIIISIAHNLHALATIIVYVVTVNIICVVKLDNSIEF